jgi:hypothetical protein
MEDICMVALPCHSISLDNKKNEHHSQANEQRDLFAAMTAAELPGRKMKFC